MQFYVVPGSCPALPDMPDIEKNVCLNNDM